ncbi:acyltransferase family protein [Saxibacter everestensis]|uniref:Acyltransferase family protein n=1 Tax=Saxibacter everestensis TaxID=2909229 RepID=A0ABY8R0C4_9MICO|nr:acyltransferase family protein [Brevibacteriaceae bacterium ZFBP1038]
MLDRFSNVDPARTSTGWMNSARAFAIMAVVCIHMLAATIEDGGMNFSSGWWAANILDSAIRWSVPVFLMISGALALDPKRGIQPRYFLLKRWYRIGIPLVFWTVFYVVFRLFVLGGYQEGWDPIRAIVSGSPFVQLYFLYVLAGLVLLTPFLRLLTTHGSRRLQYGSAAIFLCIGISDQLFMYAFSVGSYNAVTRFLPMVGYYVLGWCLRDVVVRREGAALAWVGFIGSTAATALLARFGPGDQPWRYVYDYLSPTVVLAAICVYLLMHRYMSRDLPILETLAPLSFGVFLIHAVFVFGVRLYLDKPETVAEVLLQGIGLTIVYTILSALVTWLAIRVPYVRAVFGASDPKVPPAAPVRVT